jgi:hypothetical protein
MAGAVRPGGLADLLQIARPQRNAEAAARLRAS